MNPQLKSALTSALLVLFTSATTWASTKGLISNGDVATLANALVTVAGAIVTGAVGYYKARQVAPAALIQAVNSGDNGVRVVPAMVPEGIAPTVDRPLK